jgi:hypothetical protein
VERERFFYRGAVLEGLLVMTALFNMPKRLGGEWVGA